MEALGVDSLPLPALVVAGDGRLHALNARCREMLSTDEVLDGTRLEALFPDEASLRERLRGAAATRQPLRLHARRRNGVPLSADAFVSLVDADGTLLCLLREVRDVQLIDESQRWLHVAFETAPIGMALFDTDGCYVRVNAALCRMLRRPPDELLGRRDQEMTHPDDRQADVDAAWRILDGKMDTFQTEKRFLAPDGAIVWAIANLAFLRDDAGRPLCWLGQFQDITVRKEQEQQLRHLAEHDELTGVANRRRLLAELEDRVLHAARYAEPGAVLVLDLDGFKAINDTQGHHAGDRVLVAVASALASRLRSSDVIGRLGGDEFCVILPHADAEQAHTVADALLAAVREVAPRGVSASCGIALYGDGESCATSLLASADRAMYQAKAAGRDVAVLAGRPTV